MSVSKKLDLTRNKNDAKATRLASAVFLMLLVGVLLTSIFLVGMGGLDSNSLRDKQALGALLLITVFHTSVAILFLIRGIAKSLQNEFAVREQFVNQKAVDKRLRELAVETQSASNESLALQIRQAKEGRSKELDDEAGEAKTAFRAKQEVFCDFCRLLIKLGYEVRMYEDGSPSFKLYLPPGK